MQRPRCTCWTIAFLSSLNIRAVSCEPVLSGSTHWDVGVLPSGNSRGLLGQCVRGVGPLLRCNKGPGGSVRVPAQHEPQVQVARARCHSVPLDLYLFPYILSYTAALPDTPHSSCCCTVCAVSALQQLSSHIPSPPHAQGLCAHVWQADRQPAALCPAPGSRSMPVATLGLHFGGLNGGVCRKGTPRAWAGQRGGVPSVHPGHHFRPKCL